MDENFLLIKRGLYYRPESKGYTGVKDEAGRFSLEEIALRVGVNGPDGPTDGITAVSEVEAPDFSPSCCIEVKARALESEVEQLRDLVQWAYEILHEINVSNYDHDDVCRLNDASVEVILGLQTALPKYQKARDRNDQ